MFVLGCIPAHVLGVCTGSWRPAGSSHCSALWRPQPIRCLTLCASVLVQVRRRCYPFCGRWQGQATCSRTACFWISMARIACSPLWKAARLRVLALSSTIPSSRYVSLLLIGYDAASCSSHSGPTTAITRQLTFQKPAVHCMMFGSLGADALIEWTCTCRSR